MGGEKTDTWLPTALPLSMHLSQHKLHPFTESRNSGPQFRHAHSYGWRRELQRLPWTQKNGAPQSWNSQQLQLVRFNGQQTYMCFRKGPCLRHPSPSTFVVSWFSMFYPSWHSAILPWSESLLAGAHPKPVRGICNCPPQVSSWALLL